nr:Chain A, Astexin2-dC4 [Asticcacaulis excentricus CB 48]
GLTQIQALDSVSGQFRDQLG